jgi:periodic tryptophan protein 2
LCGILYNSGNIHFTSDESDILLSPVGNKVTAFDLKNGFTNTLPVEARSNIALIEVSPDSKFLILVDIGRFS